MPLPPSVAREELHLRRIELRGYRRVDGLYDVEARMVDTKSEPITLIDGEKLLDLLVEYEVGFRKKTIELLELDSQAFTDSEHDAAVGTK